MRISVYAVVTTQINLMRIEHPGSIVQSNKYMSSVRNKVMELSLGVSVLLSLHLKSVQINNIHAIISVHCLGPRAILSALVNAAL